MDGSAFLPLGKIAALALGLGLGLVGCLPETGSTSGPGSIELPSTALATFRIEEEIFKVYVTRRETIADLLALWKGTGTKRVPDGLLQSGSGPGDYNEPWAWHLHPAQIVMTETADPACNASTLSEVEENLEEWLAKGRLCPEFAVLVDFKGDPH